MRIALDPTPLHHTHSFLEFPRVAAELGYEWIQLTPHVDFMPFFRYPRADRALLAAVRSDLVEHLRSLPDEEVQAGLRRLVDGVVRPG